MRFISVTDQFDSKTADFSEKSFVVPIKNFVNESYKRDSALERERLQRRVQELGEMINGEKEILMKKNVSVEQMMEYLGYVYYPGICSNDLIFSGVLCVRGSLPD